MHKRFFDLTTEYGIQDAKDELENIYRNKNTDTSTTLHCIDGGITLAAIIGGVVGGTLGFLFGNHLANEQHEAEQIALALVNALGNYTEIEITIDRGLGMKVLGEIKGRPINFTFDITGNNKITIKARR